MNELAGDASPGGGVSPRSHLVPEVHVHLVAAIPNGLTVEYMPWTLRLFEETPALEGGQLVVPRKPGLGLAFDQAAIKRYQVG